MKINIPFNKPHLASEEIQNIRKAHILGKLSGDGFYTKKCHEWLEKATGTKKALLTHSCTGALEMMTLIIKLKPGDEIIMPSYAFSSTANAVALRGGVPVFVDIRDDTLNIDEDLIEKAITPRTKAIFIIHYAGVGCEMEKIVKIANKHKVHLFEDAAQGLLAKYKDRSLGTFGSMGAISFHETKNIISGEGGALLINDKKLIETAEIIREKGTNRSKFFRGLVDKYTWVDVGSSYLPSEITAAFLSAQLDKAEMITKKRMIIWNTYHFELKDLEVKGYLKRPKIPKHVKHNGHIYYILVKDVTTRDNLISFLRTYRIYAPFHYVPLHSSPAGKKYGRVVGKMKITNKISKTIVRLPLFYDISDNDVKKVIKVIKEFFLKNK